MKIRKILALLTVICLVIAMIPITASAYTVNGKVSEVGLTVPVPGSGQNAEKAVNAIGVEHGMVYRVTSVNWRKEGYNDAFLGVDGVEDYFIGGNSYTVEVVLELKEGNAENGWNFEYDGENTDYSGIKATINGEEAVVTYTRLNPSSKKIRVEYTFENIPVKNIVPIAYVPAPVAGETYPSYEKITVASERNTYISSVDYFWYVEYGLGWKKMSDDETFVAGKSYRVEFAILTYPGFRYDVEGSLEIVGNAKNIDGYVNGKKTTMKSEKLGVNDLGQNVYNDRAVFVAYEFDSCEAQKLTDVSFTDVYTPTEGQHPVYKAPTMGDGYSLVTDDAISGGAEYGFVNGISWSTAGGSELLNAESVFEKGKIYKVSFLIRTDDIYRFADWYELNASADAGYVEINPLDDPTLAFVTIDFGPCEGGVLNTIDISGVAAPVKGQTPDYDFLYGSGFGLGGETGYIQWTNVADGTVLSETDVFEYGNTYELSVILKADKDGGFTFAPHNTLTAKINGENAYSISDFDGNSEDEWVKVTLRFECEAAVLKEVAVTTKTPLEGDYPQVVSPVGALPVMVLDYTFIDTETGVELEGAFEGGKSYQLSVTLTPQQGYRFDPNGISAMINGEVAYVFDCQEQQVCFTYSLLADSLPYAFITFNAGEGGQGTMDEIQVKIGTYYTLPTCDFTGPDGKYFVGWSLDGMREGLITEPEILITDASFSLTAIWESEEEHVHVYGDKFEFDQLSHFKLCISPNCPQAGSWETKGEESMHQFGNNTNCDSICTECGYERLVNEAGQPLHFYEHPCSTVCPNCGKTREGAPHTPSAPASCTEAQKCTVCNVELAPATGHKPGAAATCTDPQKCTSCDAELAPALGHKPGEEATCTAAQKCTVCDAELAPALGHKPGAGPTCTEAQKCTVCDAELKPANGHSAGVEWITDENGHYKLCACGEKVDEGVHKNENDDRECDVCGYAMKGTGLGTGAIVAIVIAVVAVLGGGGFCVYWFVIKKKKTSV